MPKTPFHQTVSAPSAAHAAHSVDPKRPHTVIALDIEETDKLFQKKVTRMEVNPKIYGADLNRLRGKLQEFRDRVKSKSDLPTAQAIAMLDHGDGRVDNSNTQPLGVIEKAPGQYVVFGYRFT